MDQAASGISVYTAVTIDISHQATHLTMTTHIECLPCVWDLMPYAAMHTVSSLCLFLVQEDGTGMCIDKSNICYT